MNESMVNNMDAAEIARHLEDGNLDEATINKACDFLMMWDDHDKRGDERIEQHVHDEICEELDREIAAQKIAFTALEKELADAQNTINRLEALHDA
ncbi:hypothetical protein [Kineobactrum salinum]|uniref:Uncharacterized protein n=1 Tax=Kineobactrum salinum TaxID=2708301 RepID=A0A6C0U5B7_9GAMM|nr:hypothetical protein [Kineobactrum salinum]QIB67118.1 hypothetical protein G3T16_18670 [Kineobactrum salinum]